MIIKSNNQGQIALIILMVSAVVMTIGLSMSKKSVVETKLTTDEELLKQAFNAAESGIEYYLGTGGDSFQSGDGKSIAKIDVNSIGGGSNIVNLGELILSNNQSYTWLVSHNADGTINLSNNYYTGDTLDLCVDNSFTGSLKVDYFYYQNPDYRVKRLGYDIATAKINGYQLIPTASSCSGVADMKSVTLTVPLGSGEVPILLAVKPIGGSTKIALVGNSSFPTQAEEIRSTGTAGDISGGTNAKVNRNVQVVNKYFVPPFMLDAVTAGGDVDTN